MQIFFLKICLFLIWCSTQEKEGRKRFIFHLNFPPYFHPCQLDFKIGVRDDWPIFCLLWIYQTRSRERTARRKERRKERRMVRKSVEIGVDIWQILLPSKINFCMKFWSREEACRGLGQEIDKFSVYLLIFWIV